MLKAKWLTLAIWAILWVSSGPQPTFNGACKDEGGCSVLKHWVWLLSVSDGVTRISKGTGTGEWTCSNSPIQMWRGKLRRFQNTKHNFLSLSSARYTETFDIRKVWGIKRWGKHVARLILLWHMNGSKASVSSEKRVEMEHCSQPGRKVKTDLHIKKEL